MTRPHRKATRRMAVPVVAAPFMALALSGCVSYWGGAPPCMPPEYTVSPSTAKPGDSVTVAAPDAKCDPRYGSNARVLIVVKDVAGVERFESTAPMTDAGGFSYSFVVPADTPPGVVGVGATPDGADWCDDTGRNNRVGRGDTAFERASCAERTKPLTITS